MRYCLMVLLTPPMGRNLLHMKCGLMVLLTLSLSGLLFPELYIGSFGLKHCSFWGPNWNANTCKLLGQKGLMMSSISCQNAMSKGSSLYSVILGLWCLSSVLFAPLSLVQTTGSQTWSCTKSLGGLDKTDCCVPPPEFLNFENHCFRESKTSIYPAN